MEAEASLEESNCSPSDDPPTAQELCLFPLSSSSCAEHGHKRRMTMSDDDEEDRHCPRKKLRLSREQSFSLEEAFREHNTLTSKEKTSLARQLGLSARQVEVWFQNRRARTKLKQTEVNCEQWWRHCMMLAEENRRLRKELDEQRLLKISTPLHVQTPPTTLSICRSCNAADASTPSPQPRRH